MTEKIELIIKNNQKIEFLNIILTYCIQEIIITIYIPFLDF